MSSGIERQVELFLDEELEPGIAKWYDAWFATPAETLAEDFLQKELPPKLSGWFGDRALVPVEPAGISAYLSFRGNKFYLNCFEAGSEDMNRVIGFLASPLKWKFRRLILKTFVEKFDEVVELYGFKVNRTPRNAGRANVVHYEFGATGNHDASVQYVCQMVNHFYTELRITGD